MRVLGLLLLLLLWPLRRRLRLWLELMCPTTAACRVRRAALYGRRRTEGSVEVGRCTRQMCAGRTDGRGERQCVAQRRQVERVLLLLRLLRVLLLLLLLLSKEVVCLGAARCRAECLRGKVSVPGVCQQGGRGWLRCPLTLRASEGPATAMRSCCVLRSAPKRLPSACRPLTGPQAAPDAKSLNDMGARACVAWGAWWWWRRGNGEARAWRPWKRSDSVRAREASPHR